MPNSNDTRQQATVDSIPDRHPAGQSDKAEYSALLTGGLKCISGSYLKCTLDGITYRIETASIEREKKRARAKPRLSPRMAPSSTT